MRRGNQQQLPPHQQAALARAKRLSWLTIAYLVSVVLLLALVMGQSQAMKTAWIDDALALMPSLVFLVGDRISRWQPSQHFPFGFHRATTGAYLIASAALAAVGIYLLVDSVLTLIRQEHPEVGNIGLFGHEIWLGWLMIAALLYSGIPPIFLGRAKRPLAEALYDKGLHAAAKMDRADWLVAGAAIVGILGIRFGIWWADATAAILISLEILRDGYTHLKLATFDMLDHCPRTIDGKASDPVIARLAQALHELDWVRESEVRLRTSGRTFSGEAFVVPVSDEYLTERVEQAMRSLRKVDWRLHHLTLTPVASLSTLAEEDGPSRSHSSRDRPEQHKGGNQHQGSRVHHIIPELSGEAGRDRA